MSCFCYCSVALPHGAMGWSAVCDCGISLSYSLAFFLILGRLNYPFSSKLEDLTVLKHSPDLLNNVKIGEDQLRLKMKPILFHGGWIHFGKVT